MFKSIDLTIKYILIALIAIILWSTQAVILSNAFLKTDFSAILFPAFVVSSLFFLAYRKKHHRIKVQLSKLLKKSHRQIYYIFPGTIVFFLYHWLLFLGLRTGPIVETNLTNFLWPILFVLLSCAVFSKKNINRKLFRKIINDFDSFDDEKKSAHKISSHLGFRICDYKTAIKMTVGFVGIGLVFTHGNFLELSFSRWEGPFYGLLAAFSWATFSVYLKFHRCISYMAYYAIGAAFLSGILWWSRGCPSILPVLLHSIYLGIFPLGIAMVAWEKALKQGKVHVIGALGFLAPLFSTTFLYFAKLDFINRYSFIGGILVIIANIPIRLMKEKMIEIYPSIRRYLTIRFHH